MGFKHLDDDEPLIVDKPRKDEAVEGTCTRRIFTWMIFCLTISATIFTVVFFSSFFTSKPYTVLEESVAEVAAQQMILYEIEKLETLAAIENAIRLTPKNPICDLVPNEQRFDCLPQGDINQAACEARGCCWNLPSTKRKSRGRKSKQGKNGKVNDYIPVCYYTFDRPSYVLTEYQQTNNGFEGMLERDNASINIYPSPISLLRLQVFFETDGRLRVKITDWNNQRYEVPLPVLSDPPETKASDPLYDFKVTEKPFSFQVRRKSTGVVIFDTSAGSLSFYDQFLEISSYLPTRYIYGLGEHTDRHLLHSVEWSKFTFWTTDIGPGPMIPLYGVHPFYLSMEDDGSSNGVFLFNSNAMDIILQPAPAITYRTIGGIFDFYVFLGPSPANVVAEYIELVGKPSLPPYWSLGYHLCRWGYKTLNGTKAVTDRNIAAGIPFDVQWNDIDYMNGNKDFTVDSINFQDVPQFVDYLHSRGMHYVVIVDPGISSVEPPGTYQPFEDGMDMDVFVKNASGQIIEGRVWTGKNQAYPDFTHPNATAYWTKEVMDFRKISPIDGIWIDMNEPSDFVDGSTYGCPNSPLENPPYFPQLAGNSLRTRTLCMTAKQHWGLHYNLHNMYGITEAMVTQNTLLEVFPNKRPFSISRSTFAGQGQYGGHWSGDVFSDWYHLQTSIADMLSFNMYGMPLMGTDICGFNGDTTDELCERWSQLGSFYPFARNHNNYGQRDQDPASFPAAIVSSIRNALLTRYRILPYYNSLFFRASLNGTTVVRPLFFQYPQDLTTYAIDEQFLVGSALLVSPVLTPNTTTLVAYFPDDRWYDFYTGHEMNTDAEWISLNAPSSYINVHFRGGSIIPTQKPEVTTGATRLNSFDLMVALDQSNEACGELFWDDGEQFDVLQRKNYALIQFKLVNNILSSQIVSDAYEDVPELNSITIYGIQQPKGVTFNSKDVPFSYDSDNMVLSVGALSADILESFKLEYVF